METDPNIIQQLLGNAWVNVITAVIALGAAISAVLPSKIGKQGWFGQILQLIVDIGNAVGLNFGKAKNADDV
jgi:hypothetical protein